MTAGMQTGAATRRTITAFFDSRADAEQAVTRLSSAGISRDSIRLVPGNERDTDSTASTTSTSSGGGGGFWDSLADLFLPDEDRHTYSEGLRRGGYLVTVSTTDAQYERALDILDDEGTIDMEEREASWRSQGWNSFSQSGTGASNEIGSSAIGAAASTATGVSSSGSAMGLTGSGSTGTAGLAGSTGTAGSAGTTGSAAMAGSATGREEVIPVVEETLAVGKRDVNHGRVRVRSYVVETPVSEQVNLREERVSIERRPTDQVATTAGTDLFRERVIEVEEKAEEAVVAKEARVKEELVINKNVEQRTETVSDTVRHTEVEVEDERLNRGTGTTGTTSTPRRS